MLSDNMHLDIAGIPKLEVVIASGKAASSGTVIGRLADPSLVHVNLQSTDDCNRLKALLENKLAHVGLHPASGWRASEEPLLFIFC
jgi:hypothetical protein